MNPLMHDRVRSMSGIPLKLEQEVIGVLYLNHAEQHGYTETEVSLLLMLSDQAATAIHEARLLSNLERQVRGHRTLNEVGAELAGLLDEKEILQYVAHSATDTLDCTHCTVFRVQEDQLVVETSQGDREWSLQEGRRFPQGQGLAGWVAEECRSLLVLDAKADDRFDPGWSAPQPDPESLVLAPLVVGGQIYGVISVEQNRTHAFDPHDQRLLETLASRVSQAILLVRLLEKGHTLPDLLMDIECRISAARNTDEILQTIVFKAVEVTEATSGIVYLFGKDQRSVLRSFQHPPDVKHPKPKMSNEETLARQIMATGRLLFIRDSNQDPRVDLALREHAQSLIAAPLKFKHQVTGALYVCHRVKNIFVNADVSLVQNLANKAESVLQMANECEIKQ